MDNQSHTPPPTPEYGMKVFINSQTSMVQPLKCGDEQVISSQPL